ncbi:GGDEF domain-containing phosphodiesterase [Halomonas janggokensis]|uniref:GGDEF domain-containing phosphodiesterase n=1 Tax=Vreelandella janggokensis TaxID=370767 RepID=A0ABT4IRK9_9GAMM|nr:GGDEF domain-containing phosphodiesterase [Halomonas janggokensis]MCZ0925868.1 GGDEF domain-containing phosphodiesterase [Halomonas janggokensis]MCZ0930935.1 GGDEF domain-containing phosphodiesterase [Halomonas janggokensis]
MDGKANHFTSPQKNNTNLIEPKSLDTSKNTDESHFDRYILLVSQVFNAPIAFISLFDEKSQRVKSSVGIEGREISREFSFCIHALEHGYFEVSDTLDSDLFYSHQAVISYPYIRFYAGVVLRDSNREAIGTLCISDTRPRALNAVERSWLIAFGNIAEEQINLGSQLLDMRDQASRINQRDARTGLPDETLLGETLDNLVQLAQTESYHLVVLHLRMNNLDEISRLHGRKYRNAILKCLADRLIDPDIGILAAGNIDIDRFGAVVSIYSLRDLFGVIKPIINKLNTPIDLNGHTIRPDIDVGVSVSPVDGINPDDLLERARAALKAPKTYESIHVFTHRTEESTLRRHEIEQRLDAALSVNKLHQHYQPLVFADGSGVMGFEALARWEDEQLGVVSPGEFIPIAEKNARLSRLLTDWSMRSVCEKAFHWPIKPSDPPFNLGVNIPANQFYQPNFVDQILQTLSEHNLDPQRLTLELTEESLLTDIDSAILTMEKLRENGISLALDDFGTGYSSLNYLKRLPVDVLKIDKSFIDDLPHDDKAIHLVSGIIRIAHGLGLRVVAEGVEYQTQQKLLNELGCDVLQGYLFSRPINAEEALNFLNTWSQGSYIAAT